MEVEKPIEEITGESRHERTAREIAELLQELRVVLPGMQVLFAFLLTVPFSARFGTLVCSGLSTVLLLASSAHHRPLWRRQAREHRLRVANRLAIAGIIFLALAMVGAMFLISYFLYGSALAAGATASLTIFFVYVWFVMPLRYRLNGE